MSGPLVFRFPPDLEHLRSLRRHLRQKLVELRVARDVADSVVLVLDEIVTNAIEHADPYRNATGCLSVRLEAAEKGLLFDFEDPDVPKEVVDELAATLTAKEDAPPPVDSERGRGLFLVASNIHDLVVAHRPEGGLRLRGRFGSLA